MEAVKRNTLSVLFIIKKSGKIFNVISNLILFEVIFKTEFCN